MATKTYSTRQENMIAQWLDWKVVAGSGAAACFPGDVISDDWLGECKTHVEPGHKIFFSKSVWDKIKDEAMVKRRFPVLFVDDGTQSIGHTWCLCLYNHLDNEDIHVEPMIKGINKNISFDHEYMARQAKDVITKYPGSLPVFTADWHGDKIGICLLDTFMWILSESR